MSNSLELLIFDFDGTLADTAPGIHQAVNEMLARRQRPLLSLETLTSYIGQGLFQLIHKVNADENTDTAFGEKVNTEKINTEKISQEFRDIYRDIFLNEINIFEGALEFLSNTPKKLAVVSNKEEYFIRKTIEKSEFATIPWIAVYGGDSFEHKKPHPLPLQKVMEEAQIAPEQTLMIGDSLADKNAALQAQTHFLAAGMGYEDTHTVTENGRWKHFDHFDHLQNKINELTQEHGLEPGPIG